MNSQKVLFEHIETLLPKEQKLVDVVVDLLGIKIDSAYRRMRGETDLTFYELAKICEYFQLSMDEYLNLENKQYITFQYAPISYEESYINHLKQLYKKLHDTRLAEDKELVFAAKDIPFYNFYRYPELSIFRIYAWHNVNAQKKETFYEFYNSSENNQIISLYENIYKEYTHIPSKELWTKQTVDTTLSLLEYYYNINAFDKDMALLLIDQLSSLIDAVKQFATDGHKENETKTPFKLYSCSVDVENSFMLIKNNKDWKCTMKLCAINKMTTDNKILCAETLSWIESLVAKSTLISGNNMFKERIQFFNSIKERVQSLANKINI